ncbi:MAG: hypothetical protein WA803_05600, partial [Steroidobacteraceae bacterium]
AGFTYAGFALKDCIKGARPTVRRGAYQQYCRTRHPLRPLDVAGGFITGFGMHSCILGREGMLEILRARR